jgi:uncharacterized protein YqgC (DUF456 family)
MTDVLAAVLLGTCAVAGLALIPLGLPGLWLMVLGVIVFGALTGFRAVGAVTISLAVGLALIGEVLETWVGFRYAKRFGGSSRAGWGALVGGLVGAVAGVPVPVVGSVIGAFLGSFAGAALFEYTASRQTGTALGAGWGAVVGRAAAAAIKIGLGFVIVIVAVVAALR